MMVKSSTMLKQIRLEITTYFFKAQITIYGVMTLLGIKVMMPLKLHSQLFLGKFLKFLLVHQKYISAGDTGVISMVIIKVIRVKVN